MPRSDLGPDRFRQIVKGNGFEPKDAQVTALGTVREAGGKLAFDVSGSGTTLVVAADKTPPGVLETLKTALDGKTPTPFEINGSVSVSKTGVETIVITSASARP